VLLGPADSRTRMLWFMSTKVANRAIPAIDIPATVTLDICLTLWLTSLQCSLISWSCATKNVGSLPGLVSIHDEITNLSSTNIVSIFLYYFVHACLELYRTLLTSVCRICIRHLAVHCLSSSGGLRCIYHCTFCTRRHICSHGGGHCSSTYSACVPSGVWGTGSKALACRYCSI
jgi:hypothetical protein